MGEETTPLRGNTRGHGWHLRSRRAVVLRFLAPLAGALVVAAAVAGLMSDGARVAGSIVVGVFGVAIAATPFVLQPDRRIPVRTVARDDERGLLLPAPVLGLGAVAVFAVLGSVFLLVAAGSVVMLIRGGVVAATSDGRAVLTPVGAVLCFGLAALFLVATVAIVRSRRRERGVVLTPARIVFGDGTTVRWESITALAPYWSRSGGGAVGGGSQVLNWIVFDMPAADVPRTSRLVARVRALTSLETPALNVAALATSPTVALDLLRYYREHPDGRRELSGPEAVARHERLSRGVTARGRS